MKPATRLKRIRHVRLFYLPNITNLPSNDPYIDRVSTPILWLGSEIAISIISVSLPSIFFLAQRAYRDGAWSLLSTRSHHSKTGISSNNRPFHDEDGDELVGRSTDSFHKHPEILSNANPYLTQTKATAQFAGTEESIEHTQHAGIHVRRDVLVA